MSLGRVGRLAEELALHLGRAPTTKLLRALGLEPCVPAPGHQETQRAVHDD